MEGYLKKKKFRNVDLNDPFFSSLKEDYSEFENWFNRKSNEDAYLLSENNEIQGFLYMKYEDGPIKDIDPPIFRDRIIKIGTLKINPHGTRLGERFIKKALDFAITANAEVCYVTIFEKHKALIELFLKYGFTKHGIKQSPNGTEYVLLKDLKIFKNEVLLDYPLIKTSNSNIFLLAIYPDYHTKMFPDSILKNESFNVLEDVSHTNSIHKIYVCSMPVYKAKRGDIIVIYRTSDGVGPAEYRSVATSICVVEEIFSKNQFKNFNEFYKYANAYSIFDVRTLKNWYNKDNCYTIKMTYNAALTKRLTRQKLADIVGINRKMRWSFLKLTNSQLHKIFEEGVIYESIVVD